MNAMRALTKYRLDSATEHLAVAATMIDSGHFKSSVTISWFAILDNVRALPGQSNFKTFLAIVRHFRRNYI